MIIIAWPRHLYALGASLIHTLFRYFSVFQFQDSAVSRQPCISYEQKFDFSLGPNIELVLSKKECESSQILNVLICTRLSTRPSQATPQYEVPRNTIYSEFKVRSCR